MKSVLVVDDNDLNLKLLCEVLHLDGYEVASAASGEEALALVAESLPDLILMDVQMPGMSGTEVMQNIKAAPASSHIPIVAVTAHAMSGDQATFAQAGFDGYLSKPVYIDGLRTAVAGFLGLEPPVSGDIDFEEPGFD